jgi:hypothetical protein
MKIKVENKLSQNIYALLRRLGYLPIKDRLSGKSSFVRKIASSHYPRFHLYISEESDSVIFDLHLDQSPSRYQGQTAHNADYDSQQVRDELGRIYQIIKQYLS